MPSKTRTPKPTPDDHSRLDNFLLISLQAQGNAIADHLVGLDTPAERNAFHAHVVAEAARRQMKFRGVVPQLPGPNVDVLLDMPVYVDKPVGPREERRHLEVVPMEVARADAFMMVQSFRLVVEKDNGTRLAYHIQPNGFRLAWLMVRDGETQYQAVVRHGRKIQEAGYEVGVYALDGNESRSRAWTDQGFVYAAAIPEGGLRGVWTPHDYKEWFRDVVAGTITLGRDEHAALYQGHPLRDDFCFKA